ncbi:uncharacterized protein LOC113392483 [Vanessa tameamea]|uniref:Uncharacterized protein LOC113392483 n=1 Tax=Vanessa tameamea TaxID=334116 RepID=A0A8B8HIS5_VANTA|nr:uncharacterized protein LOC113392483 [Vanessa tameamea]
MHEYILFSFLFTTANCASYQRYGESSQYSSYTTPSNNYNQNQYPYKTSYSGDSGGFSEATHYNRGYSTPRPDMYSTPTSGNIYQKPSYTTPSYQYGQGYYNGQNYGQGITSYEMPFLKYNSEYCVNRSPQNGIYVNGLTGMWYGVEFIQHLAGDARLDYGNTCIVIHISEPRDKPSTENQLYHVQHIKEKFLRDNRHLRLLWDEAGQTIEYSLYFRNDSAGYWQVYDEQNGTLASRPSYMHFNGAVQVLKAVNDHLVLNFCQKASNGAPAQLYTVLFSRDPGSMSRWEIEAVHAMLQTKNLSVASRRMVCGNSAAKSTISLLFSMISCLIAYIIRSS